MCAGVYVRMVHIYLCVWMFVKIESCTCVRVYMYVWCMVYPWCKYMCVLVYRCVVCACTHARSHVRSLMLIYTMHVL